MERESNREMERKSGHEPDRDSAASVTPQREDLPGWFREFRNFYISGAGCCYFLCGDVHGTVTRSLSVLRYLQLLLAQRFEIVVYYHRHAGLRFLADVAPGMRERALRLLGSQWQPAADDLLAAALDDVVPSTGDAFMQARKPKQALALLEQLVRAEEAKERVAVVIDSVDLLCPPTNTAVMSQDGLDVLAMLRFWGQDRTLAAQNNPIFLLTRRLSDVHHDLRASDSGYKVLDIALPDEEARRSYIRWYLAMRTERQLPEIPLVDVTVDDLARITAGMGLLDIEDLLLLGALPASPVSPVSSMPSASADHAPAGITRALVKARKDAVITATYSDVASVLEPLAGGFAELGAMEHLISLAQDHILTPLREGRVQDVLSRLLLVGPPGTGKTYYAEALARELGFSALSLKMSNILDRTVGSSERNLKEFFQLASALAPLIIFIDEADQTDLARRGQGSSNPVAANLFGAMLQFTGDPALRGRVILVMASNRADLFDSALLSRMDAVIPVLQANEQGRLQILEKLVRAQDTTIAPEAVSFLAAHTDQYSARDLRSIVQEARFLATQRQATEIQLPDARIAIEHLRPLVPRDQTEWLTMKAIQACNNVRFCPPDYVSLWRKGMVGTSGPSEHESTQEKEFSLEPRQARSW